MAAYFHGPIGRCLGALALALVGGAVVITVVPDLATPLEPGAAPWWLVGAAFMLAEAFVLLTRDRVSVVALSPHAAILGVALFLLDPAGLFAAQLAGVVMVLVAAGVGRRRALMRLGTTVGVTAVALAIFLALDFAADLSGPLGWIAAVFAVSVATAVPLALAHFARPGEGTSNALVPHVGWLSLLGATASAGISIVALELIRLGRPTQLLLLILPFVSCAAAVWATTSEHRRLVDLRLLADAIRRAHEAPGRDASVLELLDAPRALVGADVAWIVLLPRNGAESVQVASTGPEGTSPLRACTLRRDRAAGVRAEVTREGPRRVLGSDPTDGLHGLMADLGLSRGISMPLRGEAGVNGLLLVGSRDGSPAEYRAEDLRLLETFAGNAAVMLENDRLERSVSDLSALKEEFHRQAHHDSLTSLPNRALFAASVAAAVEDTSSGLRPAVLFLDLDDFKTINDSLGHHAGDDLLVAVAGRVRGAVRTGDLPARLGGDEFAVLARDGTSESAESVAERLVQALEAPFTIAGREMRVHASVGIAYGGPEIKSADELLRNADVAMYSAKQGGKGRYSTYRPEMHARVKHRQELVSALSLAVERDEIYVHYQPIVDVKTGNMVSVEALARWDRPRHGLLSPDNFIAVAEETGLMVAIGRQVLREACGRAQSWRNSFAGMEDVRVNVNLAPSELMADDLLDDVAAILEQTGLPPDRLVLEITENGVMESPHEALVRMNEIRSLGVSLALDDFGTGHSSLAHLRGFPIDTLKIARDFVVGLPESPVDRAFFETIVRLGRSLGLDVVAEGIESAEQALAITELGCSLAQGFHFGQPLAPVGLTYAFNASRPLDRMLRVA
jgi:diguanylate cyclase (GGDEF)-like protein